MNRDAVCGYQRGTVLAPVKAKPCGWPAASLDPSCGRRPRPPSKPGPTNEPNTKIRQSQVSTLSGDGHLIHDLEALGYRVELTATA